MHTMKVQTKYYNLLKTGQKTIELRLYDEKRQLIHIGDTILFSDLSNQTDNFSATVLNLHKAQNFDDLCSKISPIQAGFSSKEELLQTMTTFYSPENQQKYGVIGIEVKKNS